MSETRKFIVSVQDNEREHMESVAEGLRKLGCRIDRILKFSGIITGSISNRNISLDDLMIDGIKRAEYDRTVGVL